MSHFDCALSVRSEWQRIAHLKNNGNKLFNNHRTIADRMEGRISTSEIRRLSISSIVCFGRAILCSSSARATVVVEKREICSHLGAGCGEPKIQK